MAAVEDVRLLIGDSAATPQFTDTQLAAFLDLNDQDVRMSAADALDAWATALTSQAADVMIGDYRENTVTAARAMGERAAALRKAAEAVPAFAIAQVAPDGPFGLVGRELLINDAIAEGWI